MFAMIAISLVYAQPQLHCLDHNKNLPKSHIQCIIHSYLGRQATPMCCAMDIQLCQPTVCSSVLCKVPTFICVLPLLWWWWTALCLGCALQEILGTNCKKYLLRAARNIGCALQEILVAHCKKYWEHTCSLQLAHTARNVVCALQENISKNIGNTLAIFLPIKVFSMFP